jgi:membrane protein YdbS with pleckstrin-like domain
MDKLPVELQPEERVVLRARRTPIYFYVKLAGIALAIVVPIAALLWIVSATAGLSGVALTVTAIVCAVWALFWLVRAYFVWYQHRHDEWIVTDQRLIDSYKRNWFDQQVASADLVNVQDLSVSKSGPLQSLFNFGDVICQTAGTNSRFVLSDVPRPADVMRVIDGTRDTARGAAFEPRRMTGRYAEGAAEDLSGRRRPQFVPGTRAPGDPAAPPPDNLGGGPPSPRP